MTLLAFLDTLVLIIHVVVCALLIGIVLIQGGKGASMSATFGMGAAATAFGARTDSFMTKLTSGAAIVFVITSLGLTFLSARTASLSQSLNLPAAEEETPSPGPVGTNEAPATEPGAGGTTQEAPAGGNAAPATSGSPTPAPNTTPSGS
jgi:preprotein translocase subunit SecG